MPTDHNRLIDAAARKALKPKGLQRKGKSRVWFDDHGWWMIQVEFQPSSWTKGSYLNVGVCWLLYEGSAAGFHVGHRVDVSFVEYTGDDRFESQIQAVSDRAAKEVDVYRAKFATLQLAAEFHRSIVSPTTWQYYHGGVILRLAGQTEAAREYLTAVATHDARFDWERGLALRAADLMHLLGDSQRFSSCVRGIVLRTRTIGGLSDWTRGGDWLDASGAA